MLIHSFDSIATIIGSCLVIFVSLWQSGHTLPPSESCSVSQMEKADTLGAHVIIVGKNGRRFPENHQQLGPFCNVYKSDIAKFEKHLETCLLSQSKQMMKIITFSLKTLMKKFCGHRNKKRTNQLLGMATCANANNASLNVCVGDFSRTLNAIALREDSNKKIPQLCCHYFKVISCIQGSTQHSCPKYSELIADMLRSLFEGVVDIICGDYTDSSDKCDSLPAAPKPKKSDGLIKSFIPPIIGIWETIE